MDEIKRYFDDDSSRYESMRYTPEYKDCHQFSYLARQAKVLELLPGTGNAILDVGCGPGVYTQAPPGPRLSGVGLRYLAEDDRESQFSISKRSRLRQRCVSRRRNPRFGCPAAVVRRCDMHWCDLVCLGLGKFLGKACVTSQAGRDCRDSDFQEVLPPSRLTTKWFIPFCDEPRG